MRRFAALYMSLVLLTGLFVFSSPLEVNAESLYIKKIVSVVYDDSGSMIGGGNVKWAYASYAMQTFCSLLNSEDQLYITYMSEVHKPNYSPHKIALEDDKIQASVDDIRNHVEDAGTPYEAVEKAKEKLRNVKETDPYTQYWLVVITDGAFSSLSVSNIDKDYLNSDFESFVDESMANGTKPQVTYMAIGDYVVSPDENTEKGIYVKTAGEAKEIIDVMKDIADKISGRTRLNPSDITQVDTKTVKIQSEIPLLNIATLAQKTNSKIISAKYEGKSDLTIKRAVSVMYPEAQGATTDKDLFGGTFIINGGGDPIKAGTYLLEFDSDISVDDLVIMFEPALEIRMVVECNGVELGDLTELNNCRAGDKITVSYKIYEVGTDNEVSLDILPAGSSCEISISENGTVVESANGNDMSIKDFVLNELDTRIKASVIIPGFNPIEFVFDFLPLEYAPSYTLTAEFGSNAHSIHIDDVPTNEDLTIVFKVYKDGTILTNPSDVKALNPQITVSPGGNDGITAVDEEGRIVFTPKSATVSTEAYCDVLVTCSIGTASASETYTVLMAEYAVVPIESQDSIVKTQFYNNDIGAAFFVTKDGVRLDKNDVGTNFEVLFNGEYEGLKIRAEVLADGTIVCIPYAEEEYKLDFWKWFCNWKRYLFDLPEGSLEITLSHQFGQADNVIQIKGETQKYIILNVVAPIVVEIAMLIFVIYWVLCMLLKPKFPKGSVIYVGDFRYSQSGQCHRIGGFAGYVPKNPIGYILKPTMKSRYFTVGTISVMPLANGDLICNEELPWFNVRSEEIAIKTDKHPRFPVRANFNDPTVLEDFVGRCTQLNIRKIELFGREKVEINNVLSASANKYTLMAGQNGIRTISNNDVIYSAKIVIYRY